MKIICGARRAGKTTRAITRFINTSNAILLVHAGVYRRALIDEYQIPQDKANYIFTYEEAKTRMKGKSRDSLVIVDNVDVLLNIFLGVSPDMITLTGKSEQLDVDHIPDVNLIWE